jgi:acyl CoA:acetate/3-ketoacid CoA transferase
VCVGLIGDVLAATAEKLVPSGEFVSISSVNLFRTPIYVIRKIANDYSIFIQFI